MGTKTTRLDLLKPGENDYYNQQTEQSDNWQKIDDYAVYTDTDKNGVWGGEYGGKIQDPIPKELNKRYIDNINGKAFICIKAGDSSVISNTIEYFTPCNVVDNLDKLQNLLEVETFKVTSNYVEHTFKRVGNTVFVNATKRITVGAESTATLRDVIPINFRPQEENLTFIGTASAESSVIQVRVYSDGSLETKTSKGTFSYASGSYSVESTV